ncbi:sensor domain-containing diguanylate cyclase [Vibrio cholerae]|uniref:sensor domain-containing diguanylate cyclase n=1 Tax=Vibrio cholerae TaxID=666 RepID=UPI001A9FF6BD|nr:sensor domain-containing diguanylate cyclase [Vibrio cholerae]MBO1365610.1 diguanylate cyclase [Vibrio cholerae]MBO1369345.1 diguanylate cyclase [Vibrio cholerae]MBO1372294.1 diguanylate cyclase [Vibrio cholerae]MBO1378354.1 diguanylate cyclase [Vibrio cholerae]MBO1405986.1 diguanylate cyclase [Vibrio cholerae]
MNQRMSLTWIICVPLFIVFVLIASFFQQYLEELNQKIDDSYASIHRQLDRAEKVVTALDYTFMHNQPPAENVLFRHSARVVDNVCQIKPIDGLVLAQGPSSNFAVPKLNLSYMLIGDASLCDSKPSHDPSLQIKLSMAPMLSFLHDMDEYIYGVHYVDSSGYIISSPDTISEKVTYQQIKDFISESPLWNHAIAAPNMIAVDGPYRSVIREQHEWLLTLILPVYRDADYQGLVAVDIGISELLKRMPHLASGFGIIDLEERPLPSKAYRPYPLASHYADYHQIIFYQLDIKAELLSFLQHKKGNLLVAALIYLFFTGILIYLNTRWERKHFEELAARDPMTGLLNRRGMESFLKGKRHSQYLAIAVLDIDDFKQINDAYGHDMGDRVICYIGEQIENHIRSSDAVARFGGEEFVIYVTAKEKEQITRIMQRIFDAVCRDSPLILEPGFTVSGGIEVVESTTDRSFEDLFKAADVKLYVAKTSGKNQLVY